MKTIAVILSLIGTSVAADINVSFRDGAPVDTFTFTPTDGCLADEITLTIDLDGSQAGLIFDITGAGAGVEVFQPFVLTQGQGSFISGSDVTDGDKTLTLLLSDFSEPLAFTIDLDDTIGQREITVTGAEISGAEVMVTTATDALSGVFDSSGNAVIITPDCAS